MFEMYGDECYLEYEIVLYIWGGEDEDGIFCKLVFVGFYWEVLL